MTAALRYLFFLMIVRPAMLLGLGVNLRHGERLPAAGPAIVVANHNSHLDTLVLMSLFPQRMLRWLRPVAAADYFLKRRDLAWFALEIIGIIPLVREVRASHSDPLAGGSAVLPEDSTLLLSPEARRAEPKKIGPSKTAPAPRGRRHPDVP